MAGNKKGNIFQRIGKGFKDVIGELKKVVWPSKEKLRNTSAVVLLVIVFFAVFLTLIGNGGRWLLDKVGFYNVVETTAEATTVDTTAATADTSDTSASGSESSASETDATTASSESAA